MGMGKGEEQGRKEQAGGERPVATASMGPVEYNGCRCSGQA